MTSNLSWLDHDASAAQRSLRLLSFFEEREARDELGIGGVRDSIADQLFPGTSTIQTRLRYVFFIPWLLDHLETRATSAASFPGAAREAENRLLSALTKNVPLSEIGVIGRESGSALKRLPSSVYWAALGSWGLRKTDGSLQQYFSQADQRYEMRRLQRRRHDEEGHNADSSGRAWHLQLLKLCSPDFPGNATLDLTRKEAEFLLDRWRHSHPESLLTWLAIDATRGEDVARSERIWEHPRKAEFPAWIRKLIDDGHRFDVAVRGAALLYNLQLAQLDDRQELASGYAEELATWATEDLPVCHGWSLPKFWETVLGKGHTISPITQRFVEQWLVIAIGEGHRVGESESARNLIRERESRLKKGRSRFTNRAARSQWGGKAGLTPLGYRWSTASDFLQEWHAGWKQA